MYVCVCVHNDSEVHMIRMMIIIKKTHQTIYTKKVNFTWTWSQWGTADRPTREQMNEIHNINKADLTTTKTCVSITIAKDTECENKLRSGNRLSISIKKKKNR